MVELQPPLKLRARQSLWIRSTEILTCQQHAHDVSFHAPEHTLPLRGMPKKHPVLD